MVQIRIDPHGTESKRVRFKLAGRQHKGPNRTLEEALADKARLDAAPDEGKPGIITAMHDEKKKADQEAEAQQKAEEARKETKQLLSKLHVRRNYGGYRMIFEHHPIKNVGLPAVVPPFRFCSSECFQFID